jgi:YkoY family integral membrane protein
LNLINAILAHIPGQAELVSALPIIFSLIIIEGLLSVDNAMAIAAMASALPKHQQKKALRYGIIGAYLFRGICLGLAAYISQNYWLKLVGAAYLLYLAAEHLTKKTEEEIDGVTGKKLVKGFLLTIIQIEIMDLSLSIDNVVAAVALDKRLWVICTGVFIGILALRFVAGICIRLIERFPVLKYTAFMLVGFVGLILLTELGFEMCGVHCQIESWQKMIGILIITATSIAYSELTIVQKVLGPAVKVGVRILEVLDRVLYYVLLPLTMSARGARKLFVALRDLRSTTAL